MIYAPLSTLPISRKRHKARSGGCCGRLTRERNLGRALIATKIDVAV